MILYACFHKAALNFIQYCCIHTMSITKWQPGCSGYILRLRMYMFLRQHLTPKCIHVIGVINRPQYNKYQSFCKCLINKQFMECDFRYSTVLATSNYCMSFVYFSGYSCTKTLTILQKKKKAAIVIVST